MTSTTKPHEKYTESAANYKATLYRTGVAVRSELEPGLRDFITLSGAPSLSGMLTVMAKEPALFAELLKPHLARAMAEATTPARRRHKVTIKSIVEEMKSSNLSPAEIQAAIAELKARKAASGE